jgi:hypothetical protein
MVDMRLDEQTTFWIYCENDLMSQAFFAIAGTIVGVLGTALTALVGARYEERKAWRESLRSVVADLASEVSLLRDLSHQLRRDPENPGLRQAAEDAHTRARGFQEQLRLTSRSVTTQEAGRWLLHSAYYQWRATQGGPSDFWESRKSLDKWLTKLHIEARKELGLNASEVYEDPDGGLPIPGAAGKHGAGADGDKNGGAASDAR